MSTLTSFISTAKDYFKSFDGTNGVESASKFWAGNHKVYYPSNAQALDSNGHKGMTTMFQNAFPDAKHEIVESLETDHKVILRGLFKGTHKGEFNGILATGKNVNVSWMDILEFNAEGKIVNEWVEMDTVGMMQQLGVNGNTQLFSIAIPIQKGQTERFKDFINKLKTEKYNDFVESRKKLNVRERTSLQETPNGDMVIVTLEGTNPTEAFTKFGQGTDSFTTWFKNEVKEIHGIDLSSPPQGKLPELIIDSQPKSHINS
jgi:predicted ester cyclase